MKNRVLSGITSTGKLTLGNYLGAINNFVKLQNEHELFIFIANLHALTTPTTKKSLQENTLEIAAWYFACGINPKTANVFVQSDVLEHTQLSYILLCHSYLGELERMTQFKDKSQKIKSPNKTISIPTGLLVYPTLMAADILLYDPDFVPVGKDQTQHLELTRTLALRINAKYQTEIFKKFPTPYQNQYTSKIMALQDPMKKMSKSDENQKNVIFLSDDLATITEKISKAVTDSENIIKYDPERKPGVSNLLIIYCSLTNKTIAQAEKYFSKQNYNILKKEVTKAVADLLIPIQKKYQQYINDKTLLLKLLEQGANNARKIAAAKLKAIEAVVGVDYR
ncbi:tryptophan--tRNA ligase [Spiroplasma attinicola]|uniref:tryptophan--tRNA ligase n=1 Tax=Spiroplasma attinicola TaxID=2904537 RepID=UPI002022B36E|nr:tryptophan--tRNA ligase [Spiroplasma sp. JKS002670]MCL8209918.1 Tryptophan--tRNA ligase [Spiroplasma sp. JKS002670]